MLAAAERLRRRRAIATWAAGIGRTVLIATVAAPFLGPKAGIITLIVSIALYQAMAAVAGCAWNSWMRDLVPESEYGRFFGRRAAATTALATTLALVCGLLIDTWRRFAPDHAVLAYSILFGISAALGLFGVWLLSNTPEQPMPLAEQRTRILPLLAAPFGDGSARPAAARSKSSRRPYQRAVPPALNPDPLRSRNCGARSSVLELLAAWRASAAKSPIERRVRGA